VFDLSVELSQFFGRFRSLLGLASANTRDVEDTGQSDLFSFSTKAEGDNDQP
jgi:hypothetical protein